MNLVYGSSFSSLMAFLCFIVMSESSLDEPGFKAPGALTPVPPFSDSSVEAPSEVRRKCVACPRRMSKKTADRHTLCVNCRGFDCDIDTRCKECLEWPEEEVRLCFSLSTAPQVFTRVMAPVLAILHRLGVRILRYLDDWLVLAPSILEALRARDIVLNLCQDLGIIINYDKSHLSPSRLPPTWSWSSRARL